MHSMACMWKKENNQVESVFCFYIADLKGQTQVVRPDPMHLYPLNCLVGPCLFVFQLSQCFMCSKMTLNPLCS